MFLKAKIISRLLIAIACLILIVANSRADKIEFNTMLAIIAFIALCLI